MTRPPRFMMAVVVAGLVAACGSDASTATFAVEAAWSRPTPSMATNGVIYMTVTTDVDDVLVAAEVPSSVALRAELHESMSSGAAGSGHHGGGDAESGEAAHVEEFAVTVGTPLVFEPGGNHVMLIDLVQPLAIGDRFSLTLRFESSRMLTTDVTVADNPPD